ncbi:MAG: penicillin-binding protein activator LpoB [Treponema sp.]|nr:penicillin-binding protein activator LpoB [Treponema sp.]
MIFRKLAVVLLALAVAGAVFAKDNLAVLPFTGGTEEEGETIAELFSFNRELNAVFTPIPRTSITRAIGSEWKFQADAGMTDPDTIMAIGKQLGANYIVAGNIGKLGNQNLLTIAILKIDDLRQVAGDVQTYVNIREIQNKLPDMVQKIIEATKIDVSRLEKLAVTPVQLGRDIDARVADTLAQILSINLIRSRKYAVYPRTATLEQVQTEYDNQGSGITADENMVDIGKGDNPRLVLSIAARRLGDQNMFNAAIINLESGAQVVGGSVDYQTLDSGITAMRLLTQELTGVAISMSIPADLSLAQALTWIANNAGEGDVYTVTLKNNENLAPQTLLYGGKKVSVTLDGGAAERRVSLSSDGSLFTVGNGVTLTLGNNVTLQGRSSNTASLIRVNGGGALVMESGSKISGNSTTGSGGGVYLNTNATFTQSGGEISGNKASVNGGGVIVVGGIFRMENGTISGNNATKNGGGVNVNTNATFTLSGGTISGNSASQDGGGVHVVGGIFRIENGTISGNNATGSGGGVLVHTNATFTMTSGIISGNSASQAGGGVYVYTNATFTMTSGEISGNKASVNGGGVIVVGGIFRMENGTISGNSTSGSGGGVNVGTNATFTQSGGEISGNSASNVGGGVFVNTNATFTQNGGTISGNKTSSNGGGVLVLGGTFRMENGTISGNSAKEGGGVNVNNNATFTLSGGTISGNSASNVGGGVVVVGSGTFTKQAGGIIYGSDASSTLRNTAINGNDYGYAVYVANSPAKKRNSTAGSGVRLDSKVSGSAGGWE